MDDTTGVLSENFLHMLGSLVLREEHL